MSKKFGVLKNLKLALGYQVQYKSKFLILVLNLWFHFKSIKWFDDVCKQYWNVYENFSFIMNINLTYLLSFCLLGQEF